MNDDPAPYIARFWHRLPDGRIQCDLCPRACRMAAGQRGHCFVRANQEDVLVLATYGRSSGFCVDPIEKKPLNHFFPGSPVLSFGTAGCNLACRYCQNWDLSASRRMDRLTDMASPETIAETARALGCRSVAFTYNDPVIFHEYAVDTAMACRDRGVRTVAVTAGYVQPAPREEFYRYIDAVNVDLKSFSDNFYRRLTGGRLAPVLDTLRYIRHETNAWLEITTLIIPGENDSENEIRNLSSWISEALGPDIPLHLTAFHPAWRMKDHPATPASTLRRARSLAQEAGLHHVYTGNVYDPKGQTTRCASCGKDLIGRDGYALTTWNLDARGRCRFCGTPCPGRFDADPGNWGPRRMPVSLGGLAGALS